MNELNNRKYTPLTNRSAKNNNSDNDVDYKNSSEIENPHPSTATPEFPNEMPARENK